MPATEQTWRDTRLLHVVFGVTSVAMLIATIWMLAADHEREWKQYQRDFRNVEAWATDARIHQQQNQQYTKTLEKLEGDLAAARKEVPARQHIAEFKAELERDAKERNTSAPDFSRAESDYKALGAAESDDRSSARAKLLADLAAHVRTARFREDEALRRKKFRAADLDVARSQFDLAVGNGATPKQLEPLQKKVNQVQGEVNALDAKVQDATTHRKNLESIVNKITKDETDAQKSLEKHTQDIAQYEKAYYERKLNPAERMFELPILDAFGRPLKIEQIWLPKLTLNNNFRDVARFDRCITCHQGIDKTAPGSASEPAYVPEHTVNVELATPEKLPEGLDSNSANERLDAVYGIRLADRGLLNADDVTIGVVRPGSLAAKAGVVIGDVVLNIKDVKILSTDQAFTYLVDRVEWGKPIPMQLRRGVPQPYVSHPRLDLFVGSMSPHKMGDIGCTVCHEGQGSATSFKWASHTPNDPRQAAEWSRKHGWFNNHHWIFPMKPARLAESTCLKCHHQVTELEPSDRFPDPPAPQLVEGFTLIRQYGCYGCHEINGYDGPNRRIGPDLRLEPNYSAAAQGLLAQKQLTDQQRKLAEIVAQQPEDNQARHELQQSLKLAAEQGKLAGGPPGDVGDVAKPGDVQAHPQMSDDIRRLSAILDDVETPGTLRKVGPSLRHVASKLDYDFLYAWIRKPTDFRPDTKMPQFFGLYDHLVERDEENHEQESVGLKQSHKYEPLEIRGVVEYLLSKSQPFAYESPAAGAAATGGDRERGKKLFETRGCLACHKHSDVPGSTMRQGPDLSHLGGKLRESGQANGPQWLYTWLRNPQSYHPRTLMPNVQLEPIQTGNQTTDPARDIAAYLLSFDDWKPANVPQRELTSSEADTLHELAMSHLKDKFPRRQAEQYLKRGIPTSRASEVKGDEVELLGEMSQRRQLAYVGRRTITKYGCSGCHDIPGFEDAKPIGTGLADWGRKSPERLAFEQVAEYILEGHGHSLHERPNETASASHSGEASHAEPKSPGKDAADAKVAAQQNEGGGHHELNFEEMEPSTGFFMKSLMGHEREGFIWQKLRDPRSYDYKKTQNKGYNERLRMPKFTDFSDKEREAIITFVLGLVAEPPVGQYVYKPTPHREAIVRGTEVIEKFNCKGCHAFGMERWKLAFDPGTFEAPPKVVDYDFLQPHIPPQQIVASKKEDMRGLVHATVTGRAAVNPATGQTQLLDEDGAPIEPGDTESKPHYRFQLWDNAVLDGNVFQGGVQGIFVPAATVEKPYPEQGGYLARFLYPIVLADERKTNPGVNPDEAWGWVPPPLVNEGRKVQSDWLHNFLLDPYPIRPAVVLRMPKFNMSSDEASALVGYFAAVDGAEYPYNFNSRTRASYLSAQEQRHPQRLADALKIITDNNYCIKCHLIGDYSPPGSDRAKGPRLDQVYKRMRGEYLLPWLANPKRLLPYTGMPQNIPPDKPVSQGLFPGSSVEQVEGLVDFLLNYDHFMEGRTSVRSMVRPASPTPPQGQSAQAPAPGKSSADKG